MEIEDNGDESLRTEHLKPLVFEKVKEITGVTVQESPLITQPPTTTLDVMGIAEIINKQSKNHYFSAINWKKPRGPVTIFDFCGRRYGRNILDLEKRFATDAIGSQVKCILQRNPTVATKKDTEKTLLYSLLTLLSIVRGENIWSFV